MNSELTITDIINISLASQDLSVKQIADKRNRSPRTIEVELSNLKRKLNVFTIQGAVARFFALIDTYEFKRAAASIFLLAILLPYEFEGGNIQRAFRCRRVETARARRSKSDENTFEL